MKKNIYINENRPHDSAEKHVSGYAQYTDDIAEPHGTLFGAIGWSKKAHAIIKKINLEEVLKSEGVVAVVTSKDIPGRNDEEWLKHTLIHKSSEGEISVKTPDVTITEWQPVERVY